MEEEEFAKRNGIDTSDPTRWQHALEAWCRKNIVFDGDNATYRAARRASDGVEHGFLEVSEVYSHALIATEATFGYVRRTILRLLNVPPSKFPELYQRAPRDVSSMRKMVRGHFLGDGSDPAPADEEYPRLEWHSSVQNIRRDDDTFTVSFRESFTVHCSPSYGFKGLGLEVRGRAEEGREPIRFDAVTEISEAGPSTAGPPPEALQLMRRAHAFASAAAGHGSSIGIPPFMLNVFELCSEQVSLFEAIEVLLRDKRPVEALVLLRSLILGTCRLEAIAQHSNPEGVALRIKLDAMERQVVLYASDGDVVQRLRDESMRWQAKAAERGVAIPEASPDLRDTDFYAAHGDSLRFAEEVALADGLAAALHTVKADPGDRHLYTRVVDAEQFRGVAGLASAALTSSAVALSHALNWPCDESLAGAIKGEAERMAENC